LLGGREGGGARPMATRGVRFRSLTKAIDTITPGGQLIFQIFGVLGQFERDLIQERPPPRGPGRHRDAGTQGREQTGGHRGQASRGMRAYRDGFNRARGRDAH
jgi:hypothetical protein